ncbi:hypothetical protein PHYSODRAFT_310308 [Phytophthora sojae]|uniref:HMA domain-containing protein n=1 Tax=Phytophthora sojae (strain P6497) TaxID=1094619 RepID=G4YLI9_PHYSP|nr:hypothetical protein PHYSODRAFT_310308 [Phytophthora sojae]EGZ30363.1 hypothetical protein PHYSODRAFT_310308 [Phytophthora sojae]|eukprot:XP_009517638.1 hypothetical protein PHYSODRAFT_310308 [Phytophthora sojae]
MQTRRASSSGGSRSSSSATSDTSMVTVAASPAVKITQSSSAKATAKKRTRRQCSHADCTKVDAGGGFCVGHGGGKKCSFPGCTKGYQTGGFCRRHGGGARCQVEGCGKVDAGRGLCRAHGGGKRCQVVDCPKADVGGGFCTAHGGGRRCSEPGCTKIDQGGGKCRAHGGARRCRRRNCQQPARGATGFCTEHGGSRVCSVQSCRRLVRSHNDTGTMCATCARSQKQTMVAKPTKITKPDENVADSDRSSDSPRNNAVLTPQGSGASALGSFSPLASTPVNSRCDGSQMANCLDNGCSRSFGGDCNCAGESCTCNSPTSLTTSRVVPQLTSSNTIATTSNQTLDPDEFEPLLRSSSASTSRPRATMLPRFELQIKPFSSLVGVEAIASILSTISGVRSVHVVPARTISDEVPLSESELLGTSISTNSHSSQRLVIVRGEQSLDLEVSLTPLRSLQLAHISIVAQSSTAWTRKEVVLRVPDMMCPGNCGTSVLNAVRAVEGVEAARLRFEHRQVVIRGDMSVNDLATAVTDIGFDSIVDATTLLPRRFRFRVDDLSDVGLNGVRLKNALQAVEGVENLVLLTDRVEVLVVAMLLDSSSLVEAAESVGFEMLELSEEAWGIPMEVVQPSLGSSNDADQASADDYHKSHQCDMNICPQNGCPRYMTTVAHTAALAVGWAVPGCGMSSGGECTCGDSCKCEGCPEHNPAS